LLKAILRFFAVIILAIFIIAFPLTLVLRNVGSLLFDPETTKMLVRANLRNSDLIASLARQATQEMLLAEGSGETQQNGIQIALSKLSEEDWRQITELVAPEDLVTETADQVVDAFSIWLNTQAAFPDVQLNLAALKENAIANASGVVSVVMNALPACDAQTIASITQAGEQNAEQLANIIPICLPPEPIYSIVLSQADTVMTQMLAQAPDTIDLGQLNQGQAPAELTQLKENLVSMRSFLSWSWVAVLAIGLIGVVLGASGIASALKWAGWPLVISGLIVLIFGIGLKLFTLNFLDQFLASVFEQGSGAMGSLGSAIASGSLNLIGTPMLLQGVLLTAIGTISLIYSRTLARNAASPGIPINRRRIGL
jgi:hypothetical protein